jgi:hydroxyacylglutathione hydrolase
MITVSAVNAFRDNYIWMIHDSTNAVAVDPGDAAPVEAFLAQSNLSLVAVLATHHHPDHVGGLADLLATRSIPVYGPKRENISLLTHRLAEGDHVSIHELALEFNVLDIPGHTSGHIAYVDHGWLFCGDTLFACGCGRLFEGTPAQMTASLDKLAALPDNTLVFCGHEYTLANIRFARAVEPESAALIEREALEAAKRDRNLPTLPSSIILERRTNPFLRARTPAVVVAAERQAGHSLVDPTEVFAVLREWKNHF